MSDPRFHGSSNRSSPASAGAPEAGKPSDPRFRGSSNLGSPAPAGTPGAGKSPTQQAKDLAGDFKQQASEAAQDATHQVKEKVSDLTEGAKELVSGAGEKLKAAAEDQKNAGADFISGVAGAVRRAASEFDDQIPQAGDYMRRAAAQIDSASDALRRRDLSDLLGGVQDFARRQPTAFLGATALAGFALVRFLKSATSSQASGSAHQSRLSEPVRSTGTHPMGSSGSLSQERGV